MITIACFLVGLFLRLPIVLLLLLVACVFMVEADTAKLLFTMPVQVVRGIEKDGFLAIPMFMLVGELMNRGGVTDRLMTLAKVFVGRYRGGMAYVNLLTNMFASAILGSATAQIAVMSKVMVPAMAEQKYDRAFATGLTMAGGMLGPIIPPSLLMIIYSVVAYQPVAHLFLAGILPGLMMVGLFALVIFVLGFFYDYPEAEVSPDRTVGKDMLGGLLPGLIPGGIVVGVANGVMTPTEAAAFASLIALFLGAFVYRELGWRDLGPALTSVALNSAMVISLIGMSTMFGWTLTFNDVPNLLVDWITLVTEEPWVFLIFVNVTIILLGMVLDGIGVMIVVVPVMLPLAQRFGVDPVHFGIVVSICTLIGLITPPVGPGLYIASQITGIKIKPLFVAVLPFLFAMLLGLFLINAFPLLSLWLPQKLL